MPTDSPPSTRSQTVQTYAAAAGIVIAIGGGVVSYARTMAAVEETQRDVAEVRRMMEGHLDSPMAHPPIERRVSLIEQKQLARDNTESATRTELKLLQQQIQHTQRTLDALCIATKARCPRSRE